MLDIQKALRDLDRSAAQCNFPVLDNVHVAVADARMTAFRTLDQWVVIFEVVGFSEPELEFVDDIYAYGSCVPKWGLTAQRIVLDQVPSKPIRDPQTNECIADWSEWSVLIGGQEVSVRATLDQLAAAGLDTGRATGPGSITEPEILRFLVHSIGHRFFADDEELVNLLPFLKGMEKFLQTTQWQHPDVSKGELPSQKVAMRTLFEWFARGEPRLFDPGEPNTHWRNWARG